MNTYYDFVFPSSLSPAELDAKLSMGWFRSGPSIFHTEIIMVQQEAYGTVWMRLPLDRYTPSKRKRQRMQNLQREFDIHIGPLKLTKDKEMLYQQYLQTIDGNRPPTVENILFDNFGYHNIFDSYEISVYHDKRLIACSIFDRGQDSLASIVGFYNPDYESYSLGLMTMQLEVEYGTKHGFKYYYPGYFVPGLPKFNYKKRINKYLEFYNAFDGTWQPLENFSEEEHTCTQLLPKKLSELMACLYAAEKPVAYCHLKFYPLFDLSILTKNSNTDKCLEHPYYMQLLPSQFENSDSVWEKHFNPNKMLLVVYNPWRYCYELIVCKVSSSYTLSNTSSKHKYYSAISPKTLIKKRTFRLGETLDESYQNLEILLKELN